MQKSFSLLLVILLGFIACRKEDKPVKLNYELDYKKAVSFLDKRNDSAFYYFNKIVTGSKDSLQIAMAYNYMAVIQSGAGDYFGSQESVSMSLKFLNPEKQRDYWCLSADYNELGMDSFSLKNYDAAINFYDYASKFTDNKEFKFILANNKANAYQKKGAYRQALTFYESIVGHSDKHDVEYARMLSNMAKTRWLENPNYNAAPDLLTALRIREKVSDSWGLNASYAHLADYYTIRHPDSALIYAGQMNKIARQLNSPDDELEALGKLIRLGSPHAAKGYFVRYQHLSDSLQTARNAAKNQFALIRYQAEKNKADNLRLQKENTDKKYEIARARLIIAAIVLAVLVGIALGINWIKKRKRETRAAIREHELKTSQKVHDVVANGLYRLMTELEHNDDVNKDHLLDQMEEMYERSRDISYDKVKAETRSFYEKIAELITAFGTETTKIAVTGNDDALWTGVSYKAQYEIENILQELMVNMKKHSQATRVAVKFVRQRDRITICYTDDGMGRPAEVGFKNGLVNAGNRIDSIHGTLSFEANAPKGLKILASFPIS